MSELVGLGLYTPSEAGRLLSLPAQRISRWLGGHTVKGKVYESLWSPQVDIGDERIYLGFRDLMEVRVASAFIGAGVPAIRVRRAIQLAREVVGRDHPLSTNRFRMVGRDILLQVVDTDDRGAERERLLNLFHRQYEFHGIIEPVLKTIDFGDDDTPLLWWPRGRNVAIVLDPARAFGQPIDARSSVPTAILAAAHQQEGTRGAARAYDVPEASVRRAVDFEASLRQQRHAA